MELVYEGQKEISRKGDLNLDIGGSSKTNIVEVRIKEGSSIASHISVLETE